MYDEMDTLCKASDWHSADVSILGQLGVVGPRRAPKIRAIALADRSSKRPNHPQDVPGTLQVVLACEGNGIDRQ